MGRQLVQEIAWPDSLSSSRPQSFQLAMLRVRLSISAATHLRKLIREAVTDVGGTGGEREEVPRAAGWSQEELAHHAGLSVGPVRTVEQGRNVRMETLHALARALEKKTSDLIAAGTPEPVREDTATKLNLRELRIALTPAMALLSTGAQSGIEPDLRRLRRMAHDTATLYFGDSYTSIAADLPGLIRGVTDAVAYYDDGAERAEALTIRSEALQIAGRYLTQIRQYDLAHAAIREALADAQAAESDLTAASCVGGMCWMLMRTNRWTKQKTWPSLPWIRLNRRSRGRHPISTPHGADWPWKRLRQRHEQSSRHGARNASSGGYAARAVGTAHRSLLRHWSLLVQSPRP